MAQDNIADLLKGMGNQGDGLQTRVWGPPFWFVLYCFAANYKQSPTAQDKADAAQFLISFGKILPCGACRENFPKNVREAGCSQKDFANRDALFHFVYRLHNCVTNAVQKKDLTYTAETARLFMESFRAKCSKDKGSKEMGCVEPLTSDADKCKCRLHVSKFDGSTEKTKLYVSSDCKLKKNDNF